MERRRWAAHQAVQCDIVVIWGGIPKSTTNGHVWSFHDRSEEIANSNLNDGADAGVRRARGAWGVGRKGAAHEGGRG